LGVARKALEPVKSKFPEVSYGDLYTYAGVVAVEEAGGPKIPFRLGRTDQADGSTSPPDGRLPDADKGSRVHTIQHIRDIFYRMGFNDGEIVALWYEEHIFGFDLRAFVGGSKPSCLTMHNQLFC
jgi:cytochrome c peroxidase